MIEIQYYKEQREVRENYTNTKVICGNQNAGRI